MVRNRLANTTNTLMDRGAAVLPPVFSPPANDSRFQTIIEKNTSPTHLHVGNIGNINELKLGHNTIITISV